MSKQLIIVFVKNIKLGKVKTRLAKTIGDDGAFKVYKALVNLTEKATNTITVDKRIYFSDLVVTTKWMNSQKEVQQGTNLGERMYNAFKKGFDDGYENIVLIGSDLPDISETIILQGLDTLKKTDVVFGPAEDGGYYLIGLTKAHEFIFKNKPWSQPNLLEITLNELKIHNLEYTLLEIMNDIDTFEDLKKSPLFKTFKYD
ncbi:MAG: TIGR04282 family arsenosugar biosynthesis glycosyltransferase [Flavobacteriales bacterium]|nr:TIGR04282 family arsenosugar biosynthesis glycosyltransferase [Flavobacteriales bacterium]